jgi:site-specific recombinase
MNLGFTKYEAVCKEYNGVNPSIVFLVCFKSHSKNNVINCVEIKKQQVPQALKQEGSTKPDETMAHLSLEYASLTQVSIRRNA